MGPLAARPPAPRDKAISSGSQREDAGLREEWPFPLILSADSPAALAGNVPLRLALLSTPLLKAPKLAPREKAPSPALRSPLSPHRMRVLSSRVTLPSAHTSELNKKSESPTSKGGCDICLGPGGSAIFLPTPG